MSCLWFSLSGRVLGSVVLLAPDGSTEGLGNAKADADGNTDEQEAEENLGNEPVAAAQPGHAGPAALLLGVPRLFLPVISRGPNLAVALSIELTALAGRLLRHEARLNVRIEWVAAYFCTGRGIALSWRAAADGHDADGRGIREGSLFGVRDGGLLSVLG